MDLRRIQGGINMGKSERKTIDNKLRRKDKGATSNGESRNGNPPRSERKWWKEGYSGRYQPPAEYFENLERMRENRRNDK